MSASESRFSAIENMRHVKWIVAKMGLVTSISMLGFATSAMAQAQSDSELESSPAASVEGTVSAPREGGPAVCMTRRVAGGDDDGKLITIEISQDRAEAFLKRGFNLAPCPDAARSISPQQVYICSFASAEDPVLNARFWARYGVTPNESCQMTRRLSVAQ